MINADRGRSCLETPFVVGLWRIFQEELVLGHPQQNELLLRGGRVT